MKNKINRKRLEIPRAVTFGADSPYPREVSRRFLISEKGRFIMMSFAKLEFISEMLGSVKGSLEQGEGARKGFHAILNEINDELAGLRGSTEEKTSRE